MRIKTTIDLQQFSKLPIKTVAVAHKILPDIIVETPHKGLVIIPTKEEHYPFLFGSVTQIEKHTGEIYQRIMELDREAKDYLLNEWLINKQV